MNAASSMMPAVDERHAVRREFASAAVVCLPETPDAQAREIEAWARRASRSNGFGAPEAGEQGESLMQILRRVAANLVR